MGVDVSVVSMVGIVSVVVIVWNVVMLVISGVLLLSWCVMMYDVDEVGSVWNSSVMVSVVLLSLNSWLVVNVMSGIVMNLNVDVMYIGCYYVWVVLNVSVVFMYSRLSGIDVVLSVCMVGLMVVGNVMLLVCIVILSV